jgi:hypothetical protein
MNNILLALVWGILGALDHSSSIVDSSVNHPNLCNYDNREADKKITTVQILRRG